MYNKSEIFKAAHKAYRDHTALRAKCPQISPLSFGYCLSMAWNRAKLAAKAADRSAEARLAALDMCDRWSASDYTLADELHREIREEKAA